MVTPGGGGAGGGYLTPRSARPRPNGCTDWHPKRLLAIHLFLQIREEGLLGPHSIAKLEEASRPPNRPPEPHPNQAIIFLRSVLHYKVNFSSRSWRGGAQDHVANAPKDCFATTNLMLRMLPKVRLPSQAKNLHQQGHAIHTQASGHYAFQHYICTKLSRSPAEN